MKKNNDLETFGKEVEKWISKLGLYDWDTRCIIEDKISANGHVYLNPISRKATVCLCENRESIVTLEEIAKHEALEILLADIGNLLQSYYSNDLIDDEIHKVINRLMIAL